VTTEGGYLLTLMESAQNGWGILFH